MVVLTGDFHSSFAYDVALRPAPLSGSDASIGLAGAAPVPVQPTYDPATGSGSVAVEFATPSVTSANFDENLPVAVATAFELQINNPLPASAGALAGINPNPHMRFNDLDRHGYFVLDLTDEKTQADWYFTDDIFTRNSDETFGAAWYTLDGENRLQEAENPSDAKPEQDAQAPTAPRPQAPVLSASLVEGSSAVQLTWADGIAEDAYRVERTARNGSFEQLAELPADVFSFVDDEGGEEFLYRVKAINEVFESDYSNIAGVSGVTRYTFTLLDTDRDASIRNLVQGDIIDLRALNTANLSIAVDFQNVLPARVSFYIDGVLSQTEFQAPYTLGGDQNGNFQPVPSVARPGVYDIKAVALDTDGNELDTGEILIQVVDSDLWTADFVLVDASTDTDLVRLPRPSFVIDPETYVGVDLSLRAEVQGDAGSVRFIVDGQEFRTESVPPFALGGDVSGDYAAIGKLKTPGELHILAIPYEGTQASGNAGTGLKITLQVLGQGTTAADRQQDLLSGAFSESIPDRVSLEGNYPNPFNVRTAIKFGLPEASEVRIVLYDLLGRVVDVVAEGGYDAGWHSVSFDASLLSSGIYVYQLETNDHVKIGKMVLQK